MSQDPLALDFKSANLYALRVVLHDADIGKLTGALDKRMAEAGSFFENEPVIIDASRLPEGSAVDWAALLGALRRHQLPPIGVVAEGALREAAVQAGLTPVELSAAPARPAPSPQAQAADAPASAAAKPEQASANARPAQKAGAESQKTAVSDKALEAATEKATQPAAPPAPAPDGVPAMVVNRPLRSGQRVYARGGDLIVIGMVSQGAEVIADGNIHIYGPLRGKAMAGARGDASARIFTTQLDPELLAIAGIYRVVENRLDAAVHGRPAQVRLDNETLKIDAL